MTWQMCTRQCIRVPECQSVNVHYGNKTENAEETVNICELLGGNLMTNHSSLKHGNLSQHFYIKVSKRHVKSTGREIGDILIGGEILISCVSSQSEITEIKCTRRLEKKTNNCLNFCLVFPII